MLSPALARTLTAARPWFNERVAEARHRHPGFDVDALRDFIATELDAVAVAVARVEPDRVGEVVQVAYEIGIRLELSLQLGCGHCAVERLIRGCDDQVLQNFGITGCRRTVPHLQRLLVHLDDELAALDKAAGVA